MKKTDKYWLYLEPHTFLFIGTGNGLIYNSLSYDVFELQLTGKLLLIITELMNFDNLYCTTIESEDLNDKDVMLFIDFLKKSFSGDCIPYSIVINKPVIIPPRVNIQLSKENLEKDDDLHLETNLCSYLNEIIIFVNNQCEVKCANCQEYSRQFVFCNSRKPKQELNFEILKKFLGGINRHVISSIKITGGNIYQYSDYSLLVDFLSTLNIKIEFLIHYINSNTDLDNELLSTSEMFNINYLVNSYNYVEIIENISQKIDDNNLHKIKWSFVIEDMNEFEIVSNITDKFKIDNYSIHPFFNNKNYRFFKNHVFIEKDILLAIGFTKEDIFMKQIFNTNDYGRLNILSNGSVFANVNTESIGSVNDSIFKIILTELRHGKSWFNTRDYAKECKNCEYRYLCPSISNYELVFGKSNLCNIKE